MYITVLNVVCRIWTNVTIFSSYRNFIFSYFVTSQEEQYNTRHIGCVLPSGNNVALDLPFLSCFMYMYYLF